MTRGFSARPPCEFPRLESAEPDDTTKPPASTTRNATRTTLAVMVRLISASLEI
jgi:hypothetical protein